MGDLVARWTGAAFRAEATAWLDTVLAGRGLRRAGPLQEVKVRFWAGVFTAEVCRAHGGKTPRRVFLKVGNPGQAFEGELLAALARVAPGRTVEPWAVDTGQGWWLLPDAGPTPEPTEQTWMELIDLAAALQQNCGRQPDALLMVPRLVPDDAAGWARITLDRLAALPPEDPQHLPEGAARTALAGLPALRDAMGLLSASELPTTLQPNDVHPGNAARAPDGRLRLFDLGDAFRSHPWAVLSGPLRGAVGARLRDPLPDTPLTRRLRDRYAEHWPQVAARDRGALLAAADRLGALHRAASWERLLAPVDPDRLGVPTPRVADWVLLGFGIPPAP